MVKLLRDRLKDTDFEFVFTIVGGGACGIVDQLTLGGLSQWVLDVNIPYSEKAQENFIETWHPTPSHGHYHHINKAVSDENALDLALASWYKGKYLSRGNTVGVASTSVLQRYKNDREGRKYFAWVAVVTEDGQNSGLFRVNLKKARLGRELQEKVLGLAIEGIFLKCLGLLEEDMDVFARSYQCFDSIESLEYVLERERNEES